MLEEARLSAQRKNAEESARTALERARELESARDIAEAANRAKDQFLAVLSHELRTPLSIVRVYVDLLEEAAAAETSNPDASEWGDAASDQLGRLDRAPFRSFVDEPVDVIDAHREHDAVDDDEQHEGRQHASRADRRNRVGRAQDAVGDPRLAPDLRGDPAAQHRHEAEPPAVLHDLQVPARRGEPAAPPQEGAIEADRDHQQADPDHDAERKEHRDDRRTLIRRHALEAREQSVRIVREDERGAARIIEVDHAWRIARQHLEQATLRAEVRLHVFVKIEMVAREVREDRAVELKSDDAI